MCPRSSVCPSATPSTWRSCAACSALPTSSTRSSPCLGRAPCTTHCSQCQVQLGVHAWRCLLVTWSRHHAPHPPTLLTQPGSYSVHHAEQAEKMAWMQYQIARRLGHTSLASQCVVFAASSLAQRGESTFRHALPSSLPLRANQRSQVSSTPPADCSLGRAETRHQGR